MKVVSKRALAFSWDTLTGRSPSIDSTIFSEVLKREQPLHLTRVLHSSCLRSDLNPLRHASRGRNFGVGSQRVRDA